MRRRRNRCPACARRLPHGQRLRLRLRLRLREDHPLVQRDRGVEHLVRRACCVQRDRGVEHLVDVEAEADVAVELEVLELFLLSAER